MTNSTQYTIHPFDIRIECFQDEDGKIYLPLKRLSEAFRLNHKLEKARVKRLSYMLHPETKIFKDKWGRPCDMLCIPAEVVHGWLLTMKTKKLPLDMWDRLRAYRSESGRAYGDYLLHGVAVNPRSFSDEQSDPWDALFLLQLLRCLLPPDPDEPLFIRERQLNALKEIVRKETGKSEQQAAQILDELFEKAATMYPSFNVKTFEEATAAYATIYLNVKRVMERIFATETDEEIRGWAVQGVTACARGYAQMLERLEDSEDRATMAS